MTVTTLREIEGKFAVGLTEESIGSFVQTLKQAGVKIADTASAAVEKTIEQAKTPQVAQEAALETKTAPVQQVKPDVSAVVIDAPVAERQLSRSEIGEIKNAIVTTRDGFKKIGSELGFEEKAQEAPALESVIASSEAGTEIKTPNLSGATFEFDSETGKNGSSRA